MDYSADRELALAPFMLIEWHEGDVIRRLRRAAGWKLEDLKQASGVDVQVIHRIEMGITKEPKRDTLRKIARAFGLTDRQLLDAIPPPIDLPVQWTAGPFAAEGRRKPQRRKKGKPAAVGERGRRAV